MIFPDLRVNLTLNTPIEQESSSNHESNLAVSSLTTSPTSFTDNKGKSSDAILCNTMLAKTLCHNTMLATSDKTLGTVQGESTCEHRSRTTNERTRLLLTLCCNTMLTITDTSLDSDQGFLDVIKTILDIKIAPKTSPLFRFEFTERAAEHNTKVLQAFNYDIASALANQVNSPCSPGSEFHDWDTLAPLLAKHPLRDHVRELLQYGATFPLTEISDEDRTADIEYMLERGNHKSALKGHDIIKSLIIEDVVHGHSLPLLPCIARKIPKASMAPLGLVEQDMIDEFGKIIPKFRMTHDQSFPGPSGHSVNNRVDVDKLLHCMFGFTLRRLLHYIVATRKRHPTVPILMGKYDIKSAYRRAHLSPTTAAESLTIFDNKLLMALRMTFGGSPCPPQWCCISETICDIANDLIQCDAWDHRVLFSPNQCHIQPAIRLPPSVPFHPACELAVDPPVNDRGIVDCYIDDMPPVCPDIGDNAERCAAAVPLALHIFGHPLDVTDPIPRDDLLSLKKLAGEGRLKEVKTVLGWEINSRQMTIALPQAKHVAWSRDINHLLQVSHSRPKPWRQPLVA